MRTKDQGTLDKILKFVNKYYQENRVAPTISEVASGVGVARSTTHRYIQELSDRDFLNYGRGILSAPESAKMKTAYIAAPLVGSIYFGSPEEEEENVEEYVSLPVSLFGKGDFYILRAKGDSMVDAGIAEGDLLVIERNCPASEGDIVVALDQDLFSTASTELTIRLLRLLCLSLATLAVSHTGAGTGSALALSGAPALSLGAPISAVILKLAFARNMQAV